MSGDPNEGSELGLSEIEEPRPIPEVTSETASFWETAANGKLLLGHCLDCDLMFSYPRSHCLYCLAEAELQEATRTG